MAAAFSRSASETSSEDRFAADRALRGEETLLRWIDEEPVPRRLAGAVAPALVFGVEVGVGEPEPRVWAPEGGIERRLRGLERFAGGGFREDIVNRRTRGG